MKNACIVWDHQGRCRTSYLAVTDAFSSMGYVLEEIRVLSCAELDRAVACVQAMKKDYDNLLILTAKGNLSSVRTVLSGVLKTDDFATDGTAVFTDNEKTLFLLSADGTETGVGYLQRVCQPYLLRKYGERFGKTVIRSVGASEARVESLLAEAKRISRDKMRFLHRREFGEDVLEIFYGEKTPKLLVDDAIRLFVDGLGDTVYALDDTPLAKQLVQILKVRGKKISLAESFTGGGIANAITSVAGASAVYFEGLNTYNELSKRKRLGVSEYTIRTQGVVSDQTAYEMAAGLIATGDCDIAIATTGLAGPASDDSALPVGLCYIAVGTVETVRVYRYKFEGTREEISRTAIRYAMFLAYKELKNI